MRERSGLKPRIHIGDGPVRPDTLTAFMDQFGAALCEPARRAAEVEAGDEAREVHAPAAAADATGEMAAVIMTSIPGAVA